MELVLVLELFNFANIWTMVFGWWIFSFEIELRILKFCSATLNRYLVISNIQLHDNFLGLVTL